MRTDLRKTRLRAQPVNNWQYDIQRNVNRLAVTESSTVIGSLVALIPMAIGLVTDIIKEIEQSSSKIHKSRFHERAVTPTKYKQYRSPTPKRYTRNDDNFSVTGSKVIIPTKYKKQVRMNSGAWDEKYQPGDKIIIPSKYKYAHHSCDSPIQNISTQTRGLQTPSTLHRPAWR